MTFATIRDALVHFGLSELERPELCNAYGLTNTGEQVWLPVVPFNDKHINVPYYDKSMNRHLILELTVNPRHQPPIVKTSHVITRTKSGKLYDYDNIGGYRQVLFDKTVDFTVHAKVSEITSPSPQTLPQNSADGALFWDDSVFPTEDIARNKMDEWKKIINKTVSNTPSVSQA